MKWNQTTDQAIRALTHLAVENRIVTSGELARFLKMPRQNIVENAAPLIDAGYLGATTGVNGGYFLTKGAKEISMLDIILTLEDPDLFPFRNRPNDDAINQIYTLLQHACNYLFGGITLDTLATEGKEIIQQEQKQALNRLIIFIANDAFGHQGQATESDTHHQFDKFGKDRVV